MWAPHAIQFICHYSQICASTHPTFPWELRYPTTSLISPIVCKQVSTYQKLAFQTLDTLSPISLPLYVPSSEMAQSIQFQ